MPFIKLLSFPSCLRSLENDDYSYTTATYYLLAERVLSSYREERAREVLARKQPSFNDLLPQTEIIHETGFVLALFVACCF